MFSQTRESSLGPSGLSLIPVEEALGEPPKPAITTIGSLTGTPGVPGVGKEEEEDGPNVKIKFSANTASEITIDQRANK